MFFPDSSDVRKAVLLVGGRISGRRAWLRPHFPGTNGVERWLLHRALELRYSDVCRLINLCEEVGVEFLPGGGFTVPKTVVLPASLDGADDAARSPQG